MQGITILNETSVYAPSTIQYALCFGLFVCLIFVEVITFIYNTNESFVTFGVLGVMFIVSLISLVIINPILDYTKYEVTIDDNVKFTEFNDKYEVIKQRGLIYTIKERD